MKNLRLFLLCVFGSGFCSIQSQSVSIKNLHDSIFYSMGTSMAYDIANSPINVLGKDIDRKIVLAGFQDVMKEHPQKWDREETRHYLQDFIMNRQPAFYLARSEAWLDSIRSNTPGVQVTESGLLYQILDAGNGRKPELQDTVKVLWNIWKWDGTEVDFPTESESSPIISLQKVIAGFREGILHIGEGGKIKLWVHPDMAYGKYGTGNKVYPNEAVGFEVELIEVFPFRTEQIIEPARINTENTKMPDEVPDITRAAGDYLLVTEPFRSRNNVDEEGIYWKEAIFSYKGREYILGMNNIVLLDAEGDSLTSFGYALKHDTRTLRPWVMDENWGYIFTPQPSVTGPDLMLIPCTSDGNFTNLLYRVNDKDGYLTLLGEIPFKPDYNKYGYVEYEPSEFGKIMQIFRKGKGIQIRFESGLMHVPSFVYSGLSPVFSGSDVVFELNKDELEMKGAILNLAYFKQLAFFLKQTGYRPDKLNFLASADVDNNGEADLIYNLKGEEEVYLLLCKNGKVVKRITTSLSPEIYIISMYNGLLDVINSAGVDEKYRFENEDFILKE